MDLEKRNLFIGSEADFETHKSELPPGAEFGVTDPIAETELSSALQTKVNIVKQNAGPPSPETAGYKGQLYVDTTDAKLYQCTSVASGNNVWIEVGGGAVYRHEVTVKTDMYGETNRAKFVLFSNDAKPYDRWNYLIDPDPTHKYFFYDSDKAFFVSNLAKVGDSGPIFHAIYAGSTFLNMALDGTVSTSYSLVDQDTGEGITDIVTEL